MVWDQICLGFVSGLPPNESRHPFHLRGSKPTINYWLSWGWLGGLKSLGDFDLDGVLGEATMGNMVKLVEHQSFGEIFFFFTKKELPPK